MLRSFFLAKSAHAVVRAVVNPSLKPFITFLLKDFDATRTGIWKASILQLLMDKVVEETCCYFVLNSITSFNDDSQFFVWKGGGCPLFCSDRHDIPPGFCPGMAWF